VEISRETGPLPAAPGSAGLEGRTGLRDRLVEAEANGDYKGCRAGQAGQPGPQLRDDPPPRRTTLASSGPSGALPDIRAFRFSGILRVFGTSPAEIRQTMWGWQRGWQEGRSQR